MKIQVANNAIELCFEPWAIDEANKVLNQVKEKRGGNHQNYDAVLDAVLTLLVFRQIEMKNPGTIDDIVKTLASQKLPSVTAEVPR